MNDFSKERRLFSVVYHSSPDFGVRLPPYGVKNSEVFSHTPPPLLPQEPGRIVFDNLTFANFDFGLIFTTKAPSHKEI
jgi:hypothetical protein